METGVIYLGVSIRLAINASFILAADFYRFALSVDRQANT
jgi:hypothetical protein